MMKNVAVFFDGTRNRELHNGGTNVHALFKMADIVGVNQTCLYISGVGTERVKTVAIDALRDRAMLGKDYCWSGSGLIGRLFGAMAGYGIGGRIKEAYAFIVNNYSGTAGDRLFLFGFSRGAFAARSLAGFVNEVGVLFKNHIEKVPEAYELYRMGRGRDFIQKSFSQMLGTDIVLGEAPIRVYMIGAWDTVGALGMPPPFQKIAYRTDHHLVRSMPPNVTHGRHALALHELRSIFAPVPWEKTLDEQSIKQVWFAGAHSDVGGGYAGSTLSTIPLRWMMQEASDLGLLVTVSAHHVEDVHCAIHHEISGVYSLCLPQRRVLIDQLLTEPLAGVLACHSVDPSALRRKAWLTVTGKNYPFRRAILDPLASIDALTCDLAIRVAEHGDAFCMDGQNGAYGEQLTTLMVFLMRPDPNMTEAAQRRELANLIVLAVLAHGDAALDCLSDVINKSGLAVAAACNAENGNFDDFINSCDQFWSRVDRIKDATSILQAAKLRHRIECFCLTAELKNTLALGGAANVPRSI